MDKRLFAQCLFNTRFKLVKSQNQLMSLDKIVKDFKMLIIKATFLKYICFFVVS